MEEEEMNDFFDSLVYSIGMIPTAIMQSKIEDIKKYGKVIYQDTTTVLKVKDEVFIAKPEKGEKFDPEKGLLICILKAVGITTSDFLRLKDTAKFYGKQPKAIKCDKVNKKR